MSWAFSSHGPKYASPISSPPFEYDGDRLTVNRIERCNSKRLYELLTYVDPGPVLRKDGKPRVHQPPKHKDQDAAFYEAQLVHYGLKQFKTKKAAKNELLRAFKTSSTGKTLLVPVHIQALTKELSHQFSVKNEEARKEFEAQSEREAQAAMQARMKRKRETEELMAEVLESQAESSKRQKKAKEQIYIDNISGCFTIVAPELLDGWDCEGPLHMKLAPSSTGGHLWGSFNFGVVTGILRSIAPFSKENTVRFHWKGRETGEGESTYDDANMAEFQFLSRDKFVGTMYWGCLGMFELVGKLDEGLSKNKIFLKSVQSWKYDYRSLNDASYERERVARWGKSAGDGGSNKEDLLSDTSAENEQEDDDDDDVEGGSGEEEDDDEDGSF